MCQAVRHFGTMASMCASTLEATFGSSCSVHRSGLCDHAPGSTHADHARCSLREKKQLVDISGIPVSKGACSVY